MRGRPFRVPSQQPHFIGSLRPQAVRTRARRLSSPHFKAAHLDAAEGRPSRPAPVPEDLRDEFTDAYWRSGAWHSTSWLGHATHRAPADLLAYAELIWRLRPDWIVETRTGPGGRALFLASICDLVGNGRILSLEAHPLGEPPEHRRVTYLRAAPEVQSTVGRVREIVGEEPNALVILGASGGSDLDAALANLVPLVPVGSYVVVEDTVLGGHPAWPGFGPGPAIVAQKLTQTRDFRPDPTLEFGIVSFNVDGYLKRIR
jgi:cephalosporin hydroxylase